MKIQFILILIFFILIESSYSNENKINITLKNGKIVKTVILKVEKWGLKLLDNKSVNYNMIAKIAVFDSLLVQDIIKQVPKVKVLYNKNEIILDFNNIKFSTLNVKNLYYFQKFDALFLIMSNKYENFEFQLNLHPNFQRNLIGHVGLSYGFGEGKYNLYRQYGDVKDKQSIHEEISLVGVNYGVGYLYRYKNMITMLTFSSAMKYNVISPKTTYSANDLSSKKELSDFVRTYYLSLYTRLLLFGSKNFVSFGGRYYFKNLTLINTKTRYSINIGFGLNFK